jgi:hypothetical protein
MHHRGHRFDIHQTTIIMHLDDRMLVRARPLLDGILKGKSQIESLGVCSSLAEASGKVMDLITTPTLRTISYLSSGTKPPPEEFMRNRYDALECAMHEDPLIYHKVSYVASFSADVRQDQAPSFGTTPVLASSVSDASWQPLSFPGASNEARLKILTAILHHAMAPSDLGTTEVPTTAGDITLQAFRSGLARVSKGFRVSF